MTCNELNFFFPPSVFLIADESWSPILSFSLRKLIVWSACTLHHPNLHPKGSSHRDSFREALNVDVYICDLSPSPWYQNCRCLQMSFSLQAPSITSQTWLSAFWGKILLVLLCNFRANSPDQAASGRLAPSWVWKQEVTKQSLGESRWADPLEVKAPWSRDTLKCVFPAGKNFADTMEWSPNLCDFHLPHPQRMVQTSHLMCPVLEVNCKAENWTKLNPQACGLSLLPHEDPEVMSWCDTAINPAWCLATTASLMAAVGDTQLPRSAISSVTQFARSHH